MGEYGEEPKKFPNNNVNEVNISIPTATAEEMEATEEYSALEETLDQLDSCLDDLEHKNDSLNGKLKELLESTLQIHQEMSALRLSESSKDGDKSSSEH